MLTLATGALLVLASASPLPLGLPVSSQLVASGDGVAVSYSQLEEACRVDIFRLANREYEVRRRALDRLVGEQLLAAEAARLGVPPETLLERELAARTTPLTEGEIGAAYLKAKPRFLDLTKDDLVDRIAEAAQRPADRNPDGSIWLS